MRHVSCRGDPLPSRAYCISGVGGNLDDFFFSDGGTHPPSTHPFQHLPLSFGSKSLHAPAPFLSWEPPFLSWTIFVTEPPTHPSPPPPSAVRVACAQVLSRLPSAIVDAVLEKTELSGYFEDQHRVTAEDEPYDDYRGYMLVSASASRRRRREICKETRFVFFLRLPETFCEFCTTSLQTLFFLLGSVTYLVPDFCGFCEHLRHATETYRPYRTHPWKFVTTAAAAAARKTVVVVL